MATSRTPKKPVKRGTITRHPPRVPLPVAVEVIADKRISPLRGMPRSRIVRVTISEHWGEAYIRGRGRTYRMYPQENPKWTAQVLRDIAADLAKRVVEAEKDTPENEDPTT